MSVGDRGEEGMEDMASSCKTEEKREKRHRPPLHRVSREKAGERQRCHLQSPVRAHWRRSLSAARHRSPPAPGGVKKRVTRGHGRQDGEREGGVRKMKNLQGGWTGQPVQDRATWGVKDR